jgi:hypothetical protein
LRAVLFGEEDVVVLAGVEGRVEIDEVHRLVLDRTLKDFEVVAVVKLVFLGSHGIGMRLSQTPSRGIKLDWIPCVDSSTMNTAI